MVMLQQNDTVMQLTASRDETNCPPTMPPMSFSAAGKPSGRAEIKLSRYTFARNAA